MKRISIYFLVIIVIVITSCGTVNSPSDVSIDTFELEANETRELTICLGYEPDSLYPYQASSQAAQEVLQAIYDGPIDIFSDGQVEPVILKKMPSYADGSAAFTPVSVFAGDEVVNTYGDLVSLQSGTRVFPSECTSSACAITWDGISDLQLNQLTVTFDLLDGLNWSDGQPLTASDSVYAFQVASDPATPVSKRAVDLTASYTAADDTTIEWVGKPGLVTDAFETYFWAPMPEHVWGKYGADELLEAEEVNRSPLGWGAYMVEEWQTGAYIRLKKNPFYFRADEGLPVFDKLTFKITNPNGDTNISNLKFDRSPFEYFNFDIGEFDQEISETGCDLISTTADMRDQLSVLNILTNYYQDPSVIIHKLQTGDQDVLFFNLRESYDSFEPGLDKKINPLSSSDVRKAIGYCLDHERVNSLVYYGQLDSPRMWSGASADVADQNISTFNPQKGIEVLEKAGWIDHDGDKNTGRISESVQNIPDGTSLTFSYLIVDTLDNRSSVYIYKESLAECGIDIIIKPVSPELFWDKSTETSIFKGQFDLAQVGWAIPINNLCPLVISTNIPDQTNEFSGLNFSAYTSQIIDSKCSTVLETALKIEREQIFENILMIISEEVPFLPLNTHREFLVSRNDFCSIDGDKNTGFSTIEEFDFGVYCSN